MNDSLKRDQSANDDSPMCIGEPVEAPRVVTQAQRTQQVEQVITLIEQGASENSACMMVGIHRNTFRHAALRSGAAGNYARALAALAHEQVLSMEHVLSRLEQGDIDANAARVLVDARKWFASKFLPRAYGDHVTHEHTHTLDLNSMSEAAIRARLAELQSAAVISSATPDAETP